MAVKIINYEIKRKEYDYALSVILPKSTNPVQLSDSDIIRLIHDFLKVEMGVGFGRSTEFFDELYREIGFTPETMKGKTVVDLGSGLSPYVDDLALKYGITTYGTDVTFDPNFGTSNSHYGTKNLPNLINEAKRLGLDLNRRLGVSHTNLPFKDQSVDTFISYYSFPYIPARAELAGLVEILRCLKPDGEAYLHLGISVDAIEFIHKLGYYATQTANRLIYIHKVPLSTNVQPLISKTQKD
jgi:SAM-dependent methyltransferase